jgi:hypothetical protein
LFCFVLFCFVLFCFSRQGFSGKHFVDQVGLELRNPPASASQVLGVILLLCFVLLFETKSHSAALSGLEFSMSTTRKAFNSNDLPASHFQTVGLKA